MGAEKKVTYELESQGNSKLERERREEEPI
jgi:hypothetical protein